MPEREETLNFSPTPMHIPDGFLSPLVALICWVLTISIVAVAIRKTNHQLGQKQVPLMGIMAAFIFAAQMINFPVAGGTSGHLLGGALAAIVLGPWPAVLVMTAVIAVQGLLFQDGGLLAMGANILNMGILTAAVGYGLYRLAAGRGRSAKLSVAALAAWLSVMTGALATSLELWLSGTARLDIVVPAMLFVHALIGIGEALITVAALAFIMQVRPDLLSGESDTAKGGVGWVVVGILITLAVVVISPIASADPDGLERVAEDMGFLSGAQGSPFRIIPDYTIPFLGATPLSTILAGVIGALAVFGIIYMVAKALRKPTVNS
jgi:cobalt/nickel transport system permease protein